MNFYDFNTVAKTLTVVRLFSTGTRSEFATESSYEPTNVASGIVDFTAYTPQPCLPLSGTVFSALPSC